MKIYLLFILSFLFFITANAQTYSLAKPPVAVKKVKKTLPNTMAIKICGNKIGVDELRDLALDHRKEFASKDLPGETRGRQNPIAESIRTIQSSWGTSIIGMRPVTLSGKGRGELGIKEMLIFNDLIAPRSVIQLRDSTGQITVVHVDEPDSISVPSIPGCIIRTAPIAAPVSEEKTKSLLDKAFDVLGGSDAACDPTKKKTTCTCSIKPALTAQGSPTIATSVCADENSECQCYLRESELLVRLRFTHYLVSYCGGKTNEVDIPGQTSNSDPITKTKQ